MTSNPKNHGSSRGKKQSVSDSREFILNSQLNRNSYTQTIRSSTQKTPPAIYAKCLGGPKWTYIHSSREKERDCEIEYDSSQVYILIWVTVTRWYRKYHLRAMLRCRVCVWLLPLIFSLTFWPDKRSFPISQCDVSWLEAASVCISISKATDWTGKKHP